MPAEDYPIYRQAGPDGTVADPRNGAPQSYRLLTNANAPGAGPAASNIRGGDYIWRIEGNFAGLTATLQYLGLDGTTWRNVRNAANSADVTATADSQVGIGVGQSASMRVLLSGPASGTPSISSSLAGLS